jgi:hypothetical protein
VAAFTDETALEVALVLTPSPPPPPPASLQPAPADLSDLMSRGKYHIYAFGSEECEAGMAGSMLFPSKQRWEAQLLDALNRDSNSDSSLSASHASASPRYVLLASHTLQAIHLAVFVHASLVRVINDIQTGAVPCGIGDQLGNKGGVAVGFNVGRTALLFVNCHLAAHQHAIARRNRDYMRIETNMPLIPTGWHVESQIAIHASDGRTQQVTIVPPAKVQETIQPEEEDDGDASSTDSDSDREGAQKPRPSKAAKKAKRRADTAPQQPAAAVTTAQEPSGPRRVYLPARVSDRYDRVVWMGDLNYRIEGGSRDAVDAMIASGQRDALLELDQLRREHEAFRVFQGFVEADILFKPTYKFDKRSDVYDSGPKQRIPSWTDRVLVRCGPDSEVQTSVSSASAVTAAETGRGALPCGIRVLRYGAVTSIRTSDHRPVVACMEVSLKRSTNREASRWLSALVSPLQAARAAILSPASGAFNSTASTLSAHSPTEHGSSVASVGSFWSPSSASHPHQHSHSHATQYSHAVRHNQVAPLPLALADTPQSEHQGSAASTHAHPSPLQKPKKGIWPSIFTRAARIAPMPMPSSTAPTSPSAPSSSSPAPHANTSPKHSHTSGAAADSDPVHVPGLPSPTLVMLSPPAPSTSMRHSASRRIRTRSKRLGSTSENTCFIQ